MEDHHNGDIETSFFTQNEFPKEGRLRNRFEFLKKKFNAQYKSEPLFYLRVPGRVNLIGEHIDYCGYSVCPMALEQDILVAFRYFRRPSLQDCFFSIHNLEEDIYKEYNNKTSNFEFSLTTTGWVSYVLCGVRRVMEWLKTNKPAENHCPVSIQMVVVGNIPPGSGLSSSSALVCAGALATALANEVELSRTKLAALSAEAEQYIGTVGGGMDQAIIFLASKGCAKLIEFNPLRTRDVTLPSGGVFVVAHSLAVKNKAASNDFNTRVVECRLAAQILAKHEGFPWKDCLRLAYFQNKSKLTLSQCIKLVDEVLNEDLYSKAEVCKILEVSEKELNEITLTPNTENIQHFKLRQRALHVFQEAERVAEFETGCRDGCSLAMLGQLMSQSHASLRDLYECSHTQLDRLVTEAMGAGALGARLTGAGWGGCIVALTTEDHVEKFIETVKGQYYADNPQAVGQKIENLIFATQPGQGVQIFRSEENDEIH